MKKVTPQKKPTTSARKAGAPVVSRPATPTRIVEASGTASGRNDNRTPIGRLVEAAMAQAVLDANAEGISDPKEILKRKLAARDRVKKEQAASA